MSLIDSDAPQQKLTDAVIVTAIFPLYQRSGQQWLSTTKEPYVCLKGQIHLLGVLVLVVLNLLRRKLLAMEGQIHQEPTCNSEELYVLRLAADHAVSSPVPFLLGFTPDLVHASALLASSLLSPFTVVLLHLLVFKPLVSPSIFSFWSCLPEAVGLQSKTEGSCYLFFSIILLKSC